MAKFTTNKVDYINKTAKIGMEEKFSTYSKFLEQAPIFITYYKQNIVATTTDIGMGNTHEMIGDESSISYSKINHIPLYNADKAVFDLDYDDIMGISGNSESSGTLLPNTVEPIPNDYFTVDYMENRFMFKIMNIETEDHIKSNNYFKIGFKYDGKNDGSIEKQIENSFTCMYDNIGTEDVSIIRDDVLELCRIVEIRMDRLKELYLNNFLFRTTNSLILPIQNNHYLYDPFLTEFVYRNKVFVKERSYTTHNIMHVVRNNDNFDETYISSIYRSIEKRKISDFSTIYRHLKMTGHSNYFELCGDVYYKADIQPKSEKGFTDLIFDKLYGSILNYNYLIATPLKDGDELIDEVAYLIKLYMNDTISNEELLKKFNELEDLYIRKDIDNFIYFPILFFIIQKSMNNIILKK